MLRMLFPVGRRCLLVAALWTCSSVPAWCEITQPRAPAPATSAISICHGYDPARNTGITTLIDALDLERHEAHGDVRGPCGLTRLQGNPKLPAGSAVPAFWTGRGVPQSEIVIDGRGEELARARFEIAFRDEATVKDVNQVLSRFHARIEHSLPGVAIVVVRVPDPASFSALESIVAQVEAEQSVELVNLGYFLHDLVVPDNITQTEMIQGPGRLDHHLAVRASAAWNLRALWQLHPERRPLLVVADNFGDGPPASTNFAVETLVPTDFKSGELNRHGYHVLGIIAADFGGAGSGSGKGPGQATGMIPASTTTEVTPLRGVDVRGIPWEDVDNRILSAVMKADTPAISQSLPVVVNVSQGEFCSNGYTPDQEEQCRRETVAGALTFIRKVRALGLEEKFVLVTAAGNSSGGNAALSSHYNAASLADLGGTAKLVNTVVVENRTATGGACDQKRVLDRSPRLSCLKPSSGIVDSAGKNGISALGTDVWSLDRARTSDQTGLCQSGTSMAAPQVTGALVYAWSLRPELTASALLERLAATRSEPLPTPFCTSTGQPVLDAYALLLSTDQGDPTWAAPARATLLDVAQSDGTPGPDGSFDDGDLTLFESNLKNGGPGGQLDWGRGDLNGDGFTGGCETARFDLDGNEPPVFATVTLNTPIGKLKLDENKVTDRDILCYYAFSPLCRNCDPVALGIQCGVTPFRGRLSMASPSSASPDSYELELLLATGGAFSAIHSRVSVNDQGRVAFVGTAAGEERVYVIDTPDAPSAISFGGGGRTYLGAAINNATPAEVASRDQLGSAYFMRRWPDNGSQAFTVVGRSGGLFDSALGFPDVNDTGVVAFPALVTTPFTQTIVYAGTAEPPTELSRYNGSIAIRPSISNDNRVVFRDDLGRVMSFDYPSTTATVVGGSSDGFDLAQMGNRPGISASGDVVAFIGNKGAGAGVYVAVRDGASQVIFAVAGADLDLDLDGFPDFTAVSGTQRAGVVSQGSLASKLTVAVVFVGTSKGVNGIYRVLVEFTKVPPNPIEEDNRGFIPVAAVGGVIGGKTVSTVELFDPINKDEAVAFFATFSDGSQGVVRANPIVFTCAP